MKNKILTAVSTIMIFAPWTILPLRRFDWAVHSPTAEILMLSYAAFMIFSGIFTIAAYAAGNVRNTLMKVCLIINVMYAVAAVCLLFMGNFSGLSAIKFTNLPV